MKSHAHIGFWLVTFLVCILCTPMFFSEQSIRARLDKEVSGVYDLFGDRLGNTLVATANGAHSVLRTSEVNQPLQKSIDRGADEANATRYFSGLGAMAARESVAYFRSVYMQLYSVILRSLILGVWLLLVIPFLIAVVVDGISARQAKLSERGFQNPTAFSLSAHLLIAMCAVPLLYVAVPIELPTSFALWWVVVAALPGSYALTHAQPIVTA